MQSLDTFQAHAEKPAACGPVATGTRRIALATCLLIALGFSLWPLSPAHASGVFWLPTHQASDRTFDHLNPVLTASVNSAAGVMGKMISVTSIAVAVAATGMSRADESRLLRFTIKHRIFLMVIMAIISMLYAYVFPQFVPAVR